MAKQTAVEYLFEIWNSREPFDKFIFDEQFEQAKLMEKEDIQRGYYEGYYDGNNNLPKNDEYYKENYEN